MSNDMLWTEAVRDRDHEQLADAIGKVTGALSSKFAFVTEATNKSGFHDRLAHVASHIEAVVAAATDGNPALFATVHAAVLTQWESDFDRIVSFRHQASQQRNNRRGFERKQARHPDGRTGNWAERGAWQDESPPTGSQARTAGNRLQWSEGVQTLADSSTRPMWTAAMGKINFTITPHQIHTDMRQTGPWGDMPIVGYTLRGVANGSSVGMMPTAGSLKSVQDAMAAAEQWLANGTGVFFASKTAALPTAVAGDGAYVTDSHNSGVRKDVPAGTAARAVQAYATFLGKNYDWAVDGIPGEGWQLGGSWTRHASASKTAASLADAKGLTCDAHELLRQMSGARMNLGVREVVDTGDGIMCKIGAGAQTYKMIVKLMPLDTYSVEIGKLRKFDWVSAGTWHDIYAEDLAERLIRIFDQVTSQRGGAKEDPLIDWAKERGRKHPADGDLIDWEYERERMGKPTASKTAADWTDVFPFPEQGYADDAKFYRPTPGDMPGTWNVFPRDGSGSRLNTPYDDLPEEVRGYLHSRSSKTAATLRPDQIDGMLSGLDADVQARLRPFAEYLTTTYSRGISENLGEAIRAATRGDRRGYEYLLSKLDAHLDIENGGENNWFYDSSQGKYTQRLDGTMGSKASVPQRVASLFATTLVAGPVATHGFTLRSGARKAITLVREGGLVHWAVTDETGADEAGAGSESSVRDSLEKAWDLLNTVLDKQPPPTGDVAQQAEQAADAVGEAVETAGGDAPDDTDSTGGTEGDAKPADGDPDGAPAKGAPEKGKNPFAKDDADPKADADQAADPKAPVPGTDPADKSAVPPAASEKGDKPASPTDPAGASATAPAPGSVVDTAEDESMGDVLGIDPKTMTAGQRINMTYTLTDGTTGNVEVTFLREDNDIFFFDGPNGEFGLGDREDEWVDSDGNSFAFSEGDAVEEITGDDDPSGGATLDDIDLDAAAGDADPATPDPAGEPTAPAADAPATDAPDADASSPAPAEDGKDTKPDFIKDKAKDDDKKDDEKKVKSAMLRENPGMDPAMAARLAHRAVTMAGVLTK